MVLDGNDSVFVIDGKAVNITLIESQNVVIKNLEILHAHPDMHELKAVKKALFYVDFEVDSDSIYEFRKGRMYFYGKDYCIRADKSARVACWITLLTIHSENTKVNVSV